MDGLAIPRIDFVLVEWFLHWFMVLWMVGLLLRVFTQSFFYNSINQGSFVLKVFYNMESEMNDLTIFHRFSRSSIKDA